MKKLEELTFKELQKVATDKGIAGAEVFTTKGQLITLITNVESEKLKMNESINSATKKDNFLSNVPSGSNNKYNSKKKRMQKYLESRPKVRFMIPLGIGEKKGAVESWCENGYKIVIEKGVFQDVPDVIAELLAKRYQLTMDAGSQWDINRVKPEDGQVVKNVLG